jgi:RNA polymerase sigma-70 factor (ECF subfamily)
MCREPDREATMMLPNALDDASLSGELERLHPASFSWALACCGRDREEAQDVLQASYLKLLDGRARFEGRSSLKTFLFGVILRTAAASRRRHSLDLWRRALWGRKTPDPTPVEGPEDAATRTEEIRRLRGALVRLPHRQRQVLELVFAQEMTIAEAAEILAISVGSARTHYHRGKRRLARELDRGRR